MKRIVSIATCAVVLAIAATASAGVVNSYVEDFTTTTYKRTSGTTADWNTTDGELKLFPFTPTQVGTYNTSGVATGVVVTGDYAYVSDGPSGLQIFDISDPANPTLLGTYNTPGVAYDVFVAGDHACVADELSGLQVIDISNPASPTLAGTYNTPGSAYRVFVWGDHAYVADDAFGLQIVDISNPASPTLSGTYDTPGNAYGVFVAGDHAYVGDAGSGLQIINISNPASPTLAGSYDTPFEARGVFVSDANAFVADGISGLQIVNISDPANPVLTGSFDTSGYAVDVFVTDDYAYVADDFGGLQVLDITNPASPTLGHTYATPGGAQEVVVAGTHAFVADYGSGLQVVEVALPVSPIVKASFYSVDEGFDVCVDGDHGFVANGDAGFTRVGFQNVKGLGSSTRDTPGSARGVFASGEYVFVADGTAGLHLYSSNFSLLLLGTYDTPGFAYDVFVAGDHAFVADALSGLQIIDISDPANPSLAGTYNTPNAAYSVFVSGNHACVADGTSGLQVIDVSNPASPTLAGTYDTPGDGFDVFVTGDHAFVADGSGGLQVIDISNPASPAFLGSYPAYCTKVFVTGDFAFLAGATAGLLIVDVSNPAVPISAGSAAAGNARGVAVAGDHAFVTGETDTQAGVRGWNVLQVFQRDVTTETAFARSTPIDNSTDPIVKARLSTTQTDIVIWQLSANNGSNLQTVTPDGSWTTITTPGDRLLWRSTHTYDGENPTVSGLQIDWLFDYAPIVSVTDIPNDQGKQVSVEWIRSGHDFIGDPTQIVEYAVYRKIDSSLGASSTPNATGAFDHLSPAARDNALMMQAAGWHFLVTVPVLVEDSYAVVVPTLADSTIAKGQYRTTFRITALTATPGVFFHSPPDSGYSTDDLAPSVPANLLIAHNTGSGNTLAWDESPDSDFQYFRVYRSTDPNFTPSENELVHSTTATGWVDPDNDGGAVYYKVTALDHSGNESDAAESGTVTSIPSQRLPNEWALDANVPNPFNPTTQIRYTVPAGGGDVTLRVYDVRGRLVRTLVDGAVAPGQNTVTWEGRNARGRSVASGVYFYRLTAPGFNQTRKMVLAK